ncbi:MAG: hypothetical protein LBK72_05990 [Bifidobacteriaceae bacterium]|jgi:hypothetical protein|nr:hypothetical protein [Bifidobacteriaceae bacterium]
MNTPLIDLVAELDPARHLTAPGRTDDPALTAILRTKPRTSHRPVGFVLAAAVAAVGIAVPVVIVSDPGPTQWAAASWVPTPSSVSTAPPPDLGSRCEPDFTALTEASSQVPPITPAPVQVALSEARGDHRYVLYVGDNVVSECIATWSAAAQDWEIDMNQGLYTSGRDSVADDEITMSWHGTSSWTSGIAGPGAVSSSGGRAGTNVAKVEVTLRDGTTALASIAGGWWGIWAPGADRIRDTFTYTLTDGTTHQTTWPPT